MEEDLSTRYTFIKLRKDRRKTFKTGALYIFRTYMSILSSITTEVYKMHVNHAIDQCFGSICSLSAGNSGQTDPHPSPL